MNWVSFCNGYAVTASYTLLPSPLGVTLSCCVCVRRISLGGEGNVLYPVLSSSYCCYSPWRSCWSRVFIRSLHVCVCVCVCMHVSTQNKNHWTYHHQTWQVDSGIVHDKSWTPILRSNLKGRLSRSAVTISIIKVELCHLQGKFIRINFDASGYIAGANIESCILYKFWTSFCSPSERLKQ